MEKAKSALFTRTAYSFGHSIGYECPEVNEDQLDTFAIPDGVEQFKAGFKAGRKDYIDVQNVINRRKRPADLGDVGLYTRLKNSIPHKTYLELRELWEKEFPNTKTTEDGVTRVAMEVTCGMLDDLATQAEICSIDMFDTYQLSEALEKREGVTTRHVAVGESVSLIMDGVRVQAITGPAIILINED